MLCSSVLSFSSVRRPLITTLPGAPYLHGRAKTQPPAPTRTPTHTHTHTPQPPHPAAHFLNTATDQFVPQHLHASPSLSRSLLSVCLTPPPHPPSLSQRGAGNGVPWPPRSGTTIQLQHSPSSPPPCGQLLISGTLPYPWISEQRTRRGCAWWRLFFCFSSAAGPGHLLVGGEGRAGR